MSKRMSNAQLQDLGNKMARVITAKVNRTLAAVPDSISDSLSEYDLDELLKEIETGLADNGIEAIFYPI